MEMKIVNDRYLIMTAKSSLELEELLYWMEQYGMSEWADVVKRQYKLLGWTMFIFNNLSNGKRQNVLQNKSWGI